MDEQCYVCKSSNLEKVNLPLSENSDNLHILVCQDCGYARRSGGMAFDKNIETQQEVFDKIIQTPKSKPKWPNRLKLIASKVVSLTGKKGKVLDIGCGTGMWLCCFGDEWDKFGVEVSSVRANVAAKVTKAEVFCGPIEQYDSKSILFDLITAFALIEHLTDPKYLLKWINGHLKQNGLLVLMTGDRESEEAKKLGRNWPLYRPIEHVSFFSSRALRYLIEDAGFDIICEEWRYSGYANNSVLYRCLAKAKEIMGIVKSPKYSHYYVYVRKR